VCERLGPARRLPAIVRGRSYEAATISVPMSPTTPMPHRSENVTAAMFNEADQTGRPLADLSKRDPIRVLHVEDDPVCREVIADELSDHGFVVRGFADAISLANALATDAKADIILLDWDLPGISGIELLVELRKFGVVLPVVFLTGYAFKTQENLAFEAGAVDFIDKVRGVEILARRLRRLLKAPKPAAVPSAVIFCGKLLLNPNVGRAYWNDRDVGLTLVEYNIVHLLASNAGRWATYRTVYDRVHYEGFIGGSGEAGYQTNVRAIIRRIRKKFLQCDETFAEIENFMGLGYRWTNPTGAG
jgi:two-component system response regulator ChvI